MLSCQDCQKYLETFLDHALEVKESLDVQEHLLACKCCTDRAEAERALRAFVRRHAATSPLSEPHKRRIIHHAMRSARAQDWWHRRDVVGSIRDVMLGMVAAALVFLVLRPAVAPSPEHDMGEKLAREASRSFTAFTGQSLPLEVTESEETDVVQWVKNRLGRRLKVPWITDARTKLLGGRLCRILDRKSALLVYRRQGANVLLFAFKGAPLSSTTQHVVHVGRHAYYLHMVAGRPVALWQHNGITYSMVGNLDRKALLQMASSIEYR